MRQKSAAPAVSRARRAAFTAAAPLSCLRRPFSRRRPCRMTMANTIDAEVALGAVNVRFFQKTMDPICPSFIDYSLGRLLKDAL